ncbi:MAG: tetratricopeptide repeat protein [Thiobacillus sp.]|nr:tetratricopeptide repeat protein [Thiobacillus sp.]
MKRIAVLTILLSLLVTPAWPEDAISPAEVKISQARQAIATSPQSADAYAALGLALARRARETADTNYYRQAEGAVAKSLELTPDNREARRVRVWIKLGRHAFAEALAEAQALNRSAPDDLLIYAYLVDANVELGNYAAAEEAAQWLLDMRPGNLAGLTRAAYLRELFGDVDGALELMAMALTRTPPAEVEDQAWIITQMAHLELMRGRPAQAEQLAGEALARFPDYHYALQTLGRIQSAQGRHREAARTFERHVALTPHPENTFELARALKQAGRSREAKAAFAEFENKARAEMGGVDNANRELVLFYADHVGKPDEALRIARLEFAQRHDAFTRDVYAWALHVNGKHQEAWREMTEALSVGIREAYMLERAAAIARAAGDHRAARKYIDQAHMLAPWLKKPGRG